MTGRFGVPLDDEIRLQLFRNLVMLELAMLGFLFSLVWASYDSGWIEFHLVRLYGVNLIIGWV